jgi:hypothetical protein
LTVDGPSSACQLTWDSSLGYHHTLAPLPRRDLLRHQDLGSYADIALHAVAGCWMRRSNISLVLRNNQEIILIIEQALL